jgi:hypothetical protein
LADGAIHDRACEIYFFIVQRKVLAPNDFVTLEADR